ncbi:hypothetical protein SDC9_152580 [bioreactor metagenome]|uniref:Uncharacterized protein n=1 Tax=bioreactor metagenome TaxID=1076179 RepID=A0A645EV56_9ZZZZ
MEVHIFIRLLNGFLYVRSTLQDVLIQRDQLIHWQGISSWLEAIQVGQQETQGITNTAVTIRSTAKDFFTGGHFITVVGRCDPETQTIGTHIFNDVLRGNDVTQ